MIRFKFLTGDVNYTVHGGKWISNVQNNGEFDYYFVIELLNWKESVGEREAPPETYNVALTVVSPQEAGEKLQEAYDCCGVTEEIIANATKNGHLAELQVDSLHAYAGGAPVWDTNGNNWRLLMKQAKEEARKASLMFGFYMDRPVNLMGETGWEALKLTDPRDVIQRRLAEENPPENVKLMAKIGDVQ